MELFSQPNFSLSPLAERMRPQSLEEVVGQEHLLGIGKFLTTLFQADTLPSLILWGPPGSGKTTLASLLAFKKNSCFVPLSAVTSGIKEVKQVLDEAVDQQKMYGRRTLLFIDEIHRFNKAQQDAFLPPVEKGVITLIGATTENPSFEVIAPLLSRCRVLVLKGLEVKDLQKILLRTLQDEKRGLEKLKLSIDPEAADFLCESAFGDARRMLNTLETAVSLLPPPLCKGRPGGVDPASINDLPPLTPPYKGGKITLIQIESALQKKALLYDKKGEQHYNIISAFIKSMRDSDPDAAVYYLARMLEAGEEPLFLARRMVIFASEDVGNADPQAVTLAISCMQSFDFVGMPEGWIPLSQCATYLASAPKSNASYMAYLKAKEDVEKQGPLPTPLHLRNAPTKLMKEMGYHKGYQYAHDSPDHIIVQQHLPDKLKDKKYYCPTDIGYEKKIKEWLLKVAEKKG